MIVPDDTKPGYYLLKVDAADWPLPPRIARVLGRIDDVDEVKLLHLTIEVDMPMAVDGATDGDATI